MYNLEVKIKDLLTKKNITQKELCNSIGMSDQNLRIIFKRNSIETKHLDKISEILEVPMSYFFDDNRYDNYIGVIKDVKEIQNGPGNIISNGHTIENGNNIVIQKDNEIISLLKKDVTRLETENTKLESENFKLRKYIKKLKKED